jgi:hypothetical protein
MNDEASAPLSDECFSTVLTEVSKVQPCSLVYAEERTVTELDLGAPIGAGPDSITGHDGMVHRRFAGLELGGALDLKLPYDVTDIGIGVTGGLLCLGETGQEKCPYG